MAFESGVPVEIAPGKWAGGSDFSEFEVQPTGPVPAGITGFHLVTLNTYQVQDDPIEGRYFQANSGTLNSSSQDVAFGLDSFSGLIEVGEMLARVWVEEDGDNKTWGPAISLDAGGRNQGQILRVSPTDYEADVGSGSTGIVRGDIQATEQVNVWAWIRFRRLENTSFPGQYDYFMKVWFGDLEDEPAAWDVTDIANNLNNALGEKAIGWARQSGAFFQHDIGRQRIAFFSFTEDPSIRPPPIPSEVGEGADPWTPEEDESTTWGACGAAPPEVELTSTGLVFRDQFNRADSQSLGNGWTDWEAAATDIQIVSNQVQAAAVARKIGGARPADEVGNTDDILVQINFLPGTTNGIGGVKTRWNGPGGSINYHCRADCRTGGQWAVVRNDSAVLASSGTDPPQAGQWRGIRTVLNGDQIRMLKTAVLANGQDLAKDFVLILSPTDGSPLVSNNQTGFERDALASLSNYDEYILCSSRFITVNGLPSGYKAQVDSRPAVTESGGVATIDVETWALPATSLKILDASNDEVASIAPVAGIWGGDVYQVTTSEITTSWASCDA